MTLETVGTGEALDVVRLLDWRLPLELTVLGAELTSLEELAVRLEADKVEGTAVVLGLDELADGEEEVDRAGLEDEVEILVKLDDGILCDVVELV